MENTRVNLRELKGPKYSVIASMLRITLKSGETDTWEEVPVTPSTFSIDLEAVDIHSWEDEETSNLWHCEVFPVEVLHDGTHTTDINRTILVVDIEGQDLLEHTLGAIPNSRPRP